MIRLDETLPPLLVVTLEGRITLEDVAMQRAAYQARHDRAEKFALLVDTRRIELPDAPTRSALGGLSNEFGDATPRDCIGVTVVVGSRLAVGALTAIKWFVKSQVDLTYHTKAAAAFSHLAALAAARSIVFPHACSALAASLDSRTGEVRARV